MTPLGLSRKPNQPLLLLPFLDILQVGTRETASADRVATHATLAEKVSGFLSAEEPRRQKKRREKEAGYCCSGARAGSGMWQLHLDDGLFLRTSAIVLPHVARSPGELLFCVGCVSKNKESNTSEKIALPWRKMSHFAHIWVI